MAGGSQGGGLSLSTAALDSRISLCAPHIPFLTNWDLYFKTSHWPEMDKWIETKESRTWQSTLKTMGYFDTMNMAPWIKCPLFMGVGLQDSICPPVKCFAVYNRVKGKKEYLVYPLAKHSVDKSHHQLVFNWMREKFGFKIVSLNPWRLNYLCWHRLPWLTNTWGTVSWLLAKLNNLFTDNMVLLRRCWAE